MKQRITKSVMTALVTGVLIIPASGFARDNLALVE